MTPSSQALEGRHALVTGGARGIGLACARALLARGARVTLLGRDGAALEAAVRELGGTAPAAQMVQSVQADIADEASVRQAFAQAEAAFGPVQVLVNNAGQASSQKFERTDAALWQAMLAVNLTGTFHCMQAALPGMLAARWGRIINVASTAGLIGYAYVSAYCAAKHGVIGLTKTGSLEYAPKGIRVNAVLPGAIDTPMLRGALDASGFTEEQFAPALSLFGRFGKPEEVAEASVWLCSDASSYVTGHSLAVEGGYLTR